GRSLLDELAAAERAARPGERALDVAFAPSASHADLCAHPALRDGVLALSAWADPAGGQPEVTLAELELVADPSALEPLALRSPGLGPVAPAPLHRVRSHTAPPGVWRLLTGWSLRRQHAPWALALGPLARLAALPRVSIDGFVVAPASWRVPDDVSDGTPSPRSIRAWRRARRIPRFVQVGQEDELLPVDLDGPTARDDLRGAARVHEIWPPLGDTPDRGGRRVEAVVAITRVPDEAESAFTAAALKATAAAGGVPPPRAAIPTAAPEWITFKIFGAEDRQNEVLVEVVAPAVAAARADGSIGAWFFQRYVDGPGHRPHLRVRISGDADAFARHLEAAARDARAAGDVVAIERAPYFPETARLGGAAAHAAVHTLFEGASELILSLLGSDADAADARDVPAHPGGDEIMPTLWLVAGFDRLARAFGLDGDQRRRLAARRRAAHGDLMTADLDAELSRELRACRPALRALLASGDSERSPGDTAESEAQAALRLYARRARRAVAALSGPELDEQILPALLHLDAVRLLGPDRLGEIRAYTLWERGLESLAHHPAPPLARTSASHRPLPAARARAAPTRSATPRRASAPAPSDAPSQGSVKAPHRSSRRSSPDD
ncbi:MAG TPA: thiopeptide-type bacteriocin biosynthesis protein, partial [Polyangia bacterium]